MSKIGRKPIEVSNVKLDMQGNEVHYTGPKAAGVYYLPESLTTKVEGNKLFVLPNESTGKKLKKRELNREWGMHRALLANELIGAQKPFEKQVEIVGLGYKAAQAGDKLIFTLGYSHKIDFPLPKQVAVSIDKTGQKLLLSSTDKELLGLTCSKICDLRPPEPYKGTGIKLAGQQIIRKESKGK